MRGKLPSGGKRWMEGSLVFMDFMGGMPGGGGGTKPGGGGGKFILTSWML